MKIWKNVSIIGFTSYILISVIPLATLLVMHLFYNDNLQNKINQLNEYTHEFVATNISDN